MSRKRPRIFSVSRMPVHATLHNLVVLKGEWWAEDEDDFRGFSKDDCQDRLSLEVQNPQNHNPKP